MTDVSRRDLQMPGWAVILQRRGTLAKTIAERELEVQARSYFYQQTEEASRWITS